jgi:hypothetical protein
MRCTTSRAKGEMSKPEDHQPLAYTVLEAASCTLKDYYFALGPTNVIVIDEAPDAITAGRGMS